MYYNRFDVYKFVIKSFWNQHLVVQQGIRRRWLLCNFFYFNLITVCFISLFLLFCFLMKLFELDTDIEVNFQSS